MRFETSTVLFTAALILAVLVPSTTAYKFRAHYGTTCAIGQAGMLMEPNTKEGALTFNQWQKDNMQCYKTRDRASMELGWLPHENIAKVEMIMWSQQDCVGESAAGNWIPNDTCFVPDKVSTGNEWWSAQLKFWPKTLTPGPPMKRALRYARGNQTMEQAAGQKL